MYKHHQLAMGAVSIWVDDRLAIPFLDACCAKECVPEAPGQGIYFRLEIPGTFVLVPHNVSIEMLTKVSTICLALIVGFSN